MEYWLELSRDFAFSIFTAFGILIYSKKTSPYTRGFYCNDDSLNASYIDPNDWHVTNGTLFGVSISVPVVCMFVEYWRFSNAAATNNARTHWHLVGYQMHIAVRNWAFAMNLMLGLTEVLKNNVGRLRPHFIDVCKPDWDALACNEIGSDPVYITNIPCTTTDLHILKEARKSFPSGHAALSTFAMVYIVLYLQSRLKHSSRVVRLLMQLAYLWFAVYTSITRVVDHAHHWTDVTAGVAIGAVIASLSSKFASKLFQNSNISSECETRKYR